ncbi:MAG: hypothetical protein K2W82_16200 [Candidatus Obscuribacterales bacterium]|nr:hypothetical protein [Candidatus Obscuribacterales bacterium]
MFVLSVVGVIALVFIGGDVLGRLHPAVSSTEFPDLDAYFAHLKRRDRWVREEHIAWALLSGGLIATLNALWHGGSILPVWIGMGLVLAVWFVLTHCLLRRTNHRLYDAMDLSVLGISLFSSFLVALVLGLAGGLLVAAFVMAAVVWALLFPM